MFLAWAVIGVGLVLTLTTVTQAQEATTPALEVVAEEGVVDGRAEFIAFEKDSDVKEGLRILAALYDKNIVPSPKVDGMLGFTKLRDVTFEEAMDAVLGTNFVYEDEDNIIKVYTQEEFAKIKTDVNRMVYKVFTLYYISAAEAEKLIASVLSANGSVKASTPPETVVPTGESISGGAGGGDSMALNDTLVVRDYPENVTEIEKLLAQLDVRPLQVMVETVIMKVVLNDDTRIGINWDSVQGLGGISLTNSGLSQDVLSLTPAAGLKVGVSIDNVKALIEAINTTNNSTVMARTNIQAVNKQLGQVYIGDKIGYVSTTNQDPSGGNTQEVSFLETGTKLAFRPYIGNDGFIRMDIHPKVSDGDLQQTGIPNENSTEVATNIMVKDGQTVVIGGLFKDDINSIVKQVPILGGIPILGALFREKTDQIVRNEIVVLLTPHILDAPNSAAGAMALADASRSNDASWKGVTIASRSKDAQMFYTRASRLYLEGDREGAMREVRKALHLRPTYLQAIRLKERILSETDPEKVQRLGRVVREEMDWQERASWQQ
jgi:type II secretory pathway component GspD/PulD (secretin)